MMAQCLTHPENQIGRTYLKSLLLLALVSMTTMQLRADSIWEYEPYRVKVWLSIEPSLSITSGMTEELLHSFHQQIDGAYGATCDLELSQSPINLASQIFSDLESITLSELQANDLVLVISKKQPTSIRSAQAALEKLEHISMLAGPYQVTRNEIAAIPNDPSMAGLPEKLQLFEGTFAELANAFREEKVEAALVNRVQAEKLKEWVRQISVRFPWQIETIVRNHDKLMFASFQRNGEGYSFKIRELDCSMKWMGPVWKRDCLDWNIVPRVMLFGFRDAFTPLCRIEQADAKTALLRVRAAGLVNQEEHPALIRPGDVVMPMVKRSDRVGAEATLQSIPWTYIAVTHGDGINMSGSIFSGIRGALQGRQNKRIQRIALVVKTPAEGTELQLITVDRTVGSSGVSKQSTVPGIAVYQRTPSQDNLDMLVRSDWRGIVSLPNSPLPEIEYELPSVQVKPESVAADSEPVAKTETDSGASETAAATSTNTIKKEVPKAKVQLRVPLYLYYVKNGDIVLARLPIVQGMASREVAELPDDSRRLEAEALLRGLQNEIIDTVARRKIYQIKLDKRIKEDRIDEARKLIEELRRIPTYDSINERLGEIQQQVLKNDKGPITAGSKNRIDVMLDTTRQMMQKYLQIDLVREYNAKVGF